MNDTRQLAHFLRHGHIAHTKFSHRSIQVGEENIDESLSQRAGVFTLVPKPLQNEKHMRDKQLETPLDRIRHRIFREHFRLARRGHNGAIKIVRSPLQMTAAFKPFKHAEGLVFYTPLYNDVQVWQATGLLTGVYPC